ncbi:MAG: hypothetical protein JKY92_08740 [Magnetovibrio sp.]|nr:hypothetical protein [Magnetovibrio sp.]
MQKAFIVLATLALGACATQQPNTIKVPPKVPPKVTVFSTVKSVLARISPIKPKLKVRDVLGKNSDWVRANLGTPSFERAELDAHIWMYKNKKCILSLFLYTKSSHEAELSVLHFDARNRSGDNMDRNVCLATY